jgi:hypothetical protein
MGKTRNKKDVLSGNVKGKDNLGDPDVDGG